MEGNASVYQVNTVSRITGEGRAEFLRTWGPDFDQKGDGRGGGGAEVFMLQSKPVFSLKLSSALRGLSHRRGHVLRSLVT